MQRRKQRRVNSTLYTNYDNALNLKQQYRLTELGKDMYNIFGDDDSENKTVLAENKIIIFRSIVYSKGLKLFL